MSVAFRASASVTNGAAGTSVVVSRPAGTIDGDFLVAFVAQAGTGSVTAPSGWSLYGSDTTSSTVTLAVYYRRASGEPASWTWTLGASVRNWGWVGAYTGVDPNTPISDSNSNTYPSSGTAFSPALYPDFPANLRFGLAISAAAAVRAATGTATTWTPTDAERADLSTNAGAGTDIAGEVQDRQNAADADVEYSPTLTASQTQAQAVAWAVILNPYWQPPKVNDPVSMTVEAAIGADLTADPDTWAWTDLTARAQGTVQITRGRLDESGETQPSVGTVRLGNDDGWLTPRHPNSPWYLLWGLGTPMRIKINQVIGSFVRCQGRITSITPVWPAENSTVAMVDVEWRGLLYHLQQGESLRSPLYRVISADGPVWYWPGEDGSDSGFLAEHAGGVPIRFGGETPTIGSSGPAGAQSVVVQTADSTMHAAFAMSPAATAWSVESYIHIPSAPALAAVPILEWHTAGSVRRWRLTVFLAGGIDQIGIEGWAPDDVTKLIDFQTNFSLDGTTEAYGVDMMAVVTARKTGGNIEYEFGLNSSTAGFGRTGGSIAGTFGQVYRLDTPFAGSYSGWKYGHISVWDRTLDGNWGSLDLTHWTFLNGSSGDPADLRIIDVAAAVGVTVDVRTLGTLGVGTAVMGSIPIASPYAVMRDAERADLGILTDGLTDGLQYLRRPERFNRAVEFALDVNRGQVKLGFQPIENDQRLRNAVTVSRVNGSSATATDPASQMIGTYPDQPPALNLADDSDLANQAGFRLRMGTVPQMRIPSLSVDLRNSPELIRPWLEHCDVGARYTAVNLLDQYTPDGLDQVIEQYVETIDAVTWSVRLVGSPFEPWQAFVAEDLILGRGDTAGSALASAASALAENASGTLLVNTTAGPVWTTTATYPGDFPFDIDVGGEEVTVDAITTGASDTFTRTTSSSWGTATSGQAWTTSGGSASDHSTNGSAGLQSNGTVNVLRTATLDIGSTDFDFTVDVSFNVATPTGASITQWIAARLSDLSNYYVARLDVSTAGNVSLAIFRRLAGSLSAALGSGSVTVGTGHGSGDVWKVRFQGSGAALRAKAWLASGTEPTGFNIDLTDTDLTTGTQIGLLSRLESGNTNALPVVFTWDNLTVANPQLFTVKRAINGIVKAHSVGTAVSLWTAPAPCF